VHDDGTAPEDRDCAEAVDTQQSVGCQEADNAEVALS
jgi:hypothetical protein